MKLWKKISEDDRERVTKERDSECPYIARSHGREKEGRRKVLEHQAQSQLRENLPWSTSHIDQTCKHGGCEMAISLIV